MKFRIFLYGFKALGVTQDSFSTYHIVNLFTFNLEWNFSRNTD